MEKCYLIYHIHDTVVIVYIFALCLEFIQNKYVEYTKSSRDIYKIEYHQKNISLESINLNYTVIQIITIIYTHSLILPHIHFI